LFHVAAAAFRMRVDANKAARFAFDHLDRHVFPEINLTAHAAIVQQLGCL
jgi:hypothetical protein